MLLTVYNDATNYRGLRVGKGRREEEIFTLDLKAEESDGSANLSSANGIFLPQPHSFCIWYKGRQ